MPQKPEPLTALAVSRLTGRGLHAAGVVSGLYLQIAKGGSRSWVLRTMVGSKRRDIGLGGYPTTSLAQARERARKARTQIREGIDPVQHRRSLREALRASITFDQAASKYLASKRHEFRSNKHAREWESTLSTYASPIIGSLPVDRVELVHIVSILEPLWLSKTATASRLRGRVEAVLNWATVGGYRKGENPARWRGHLDAILPKPRKVAKVKHHRALPYEQISQFMQALRNREGMPCRALEFVILTAARSGEVRGATWSEIDLQARIWTVPPERIKAGVEHRVPLSDAAMELLEALPRIEELVFPSTRSGPISYVTLARFMPNDDAVPHGFRSTFRTWAAETTNCPREVVEQALAHVIGNLVERAYQRGDLFEKRKHLMQLWADYVMGA